MKERKQRMADLGLTLVLVALNLVALNYLVAGWSTARLDLTEEGLYSISPATKRLLTALDEDLSIYGYFSERTHPKLAPLVPQLEDLLDEYRAVSRGKVHVEIMDPAQDEAAAQEAADRYGVQSTPFKLASKYETGIVNAYFALVVKYGDQYVRYGFGDLIEVELMPDDIEVRLRNPEYDLTRAIKKIVYGFRTTNELFERVEEPVRLTAIITPETLPEMLIDVPEAVRKAADELKEQGGDNFLYEELDPDASDQARAEVDARYGLPPLSMGLFSEESFYLYGILEVAGQLEQIVLTGQDVTAATIRESVENSLRRHTPGFLKTVGIVAPTPVQLPPQIQMQMQVPPQRPEFEQIKRYLGEDYQVQDVSLDADGGVPSEIDVLLVIKPKELDEAALFNLDQYLMRGGRVVVCAGNYEADLGVQGLSVVPVNTGLDDWLAHQGLRVGKSLVLDDQNQPLPIPEVRNTLLGAMRTLRLEPYPYLVQVLDDGFSDPDITATLDSVGIYWGSPIEIVMDDTRAADIETIPILKSSDRSWTSDDLSQVAYVDYVVPEDTESSLLSVALAGKFRSYYSDRPVPGAEPDAEASADDGEDEVDEASLPPVALTESPETRLVLVGNAEFLSDFVATIISQVDPNLFVENLRFIENVIDWITLDNDMMGIRSRGMVSRRLDREDVKSEVAIEAMNYVLPAVGLLTLGLLVRTRRRQAVEASANAIGEGTS